MRKSKKATEYIYRAKDCVDTQDAFIAIQFTKEAISIYKLANQSTKSLYKRLISLEKKFKQLSEKEI